MRSPGYLTHNRSGDGAFSHFSVKCSPSQASSNPKLDVGSGLGGAARFVAGRYGSRVTGVDLTAEYVETARTLSEWTGLGRFHHGSALDTTS